jgi:hypothetical protein
MTLRATCFSAVTAALLMATASTGAKANVEVGGLSCRSLGGVSYIVGATMSFQCVFVPSYGGPVHRYVGVIRRVGVDLGWTNGVSLGWTVFAPTGVIHPGDLAGSYGGVQGSASIGVGVGANAMVGGSNNTFALQPVSAQAQGGLNVAAGFTGLELRSDYGYGGYFHHHHVRHHHRG